MKCLEIQFLLIALLAFTVFLYNSWYIYSEIESKLENSPILDSNIPQFYKEKVKRVFIFGIDGIGIFPRMNPTPFIQSLLESSLHTFSGLTVSPTLSGPAWGSILHSVEPDKHNLTNFCHTPFRPDSPYPSIFRVVREKYINASISVLTSWEPIIKGMLEPDIGIDGGVRKNDESLINSFIDYLIKNDPKLSFLMLDETDYYGHRYGYFSREQSDYLYIVDGYLQKIYDMLVKKNYVNDSLIMLVTDHGGGGVHPNKHGSDEFSDKQVFFICSGPNIDSSEFDNFSVKDIGAFVSHFLGIKQPPLWEGKLPKQIVK
ncbi:Type I phosphodiesterase/nucleotide pyrophosphatase [Tritrichomonas foetus]|uniref:Type I phosphodiesterase/nucleotide pyrophosphatase n=1 Tax=Tritrichomonas foetus TaxID=1144522 RepID=A0A1J4KTK1_9EUKA|nr:Type I phosphodiesterase/nucleotide pyrophosphatase [Tritrichomonas foetus]|eukprot:OHT13092.1 Type I phosphodiesterase/nucleotide pyrophosphatase [Tritrichomonas foetus]